MRDTEISGPWYRGPSRLPRRGGGSAAAMAATGLAEVLGGTTAQIVPGSMGRRIAPRLHHRSRFCASCTLLSWHSGGSLSTFQCATSRSQQPDGGGTPLRVPHAAMSEEPRRSGVRSFHYRRLQLVYRGILDLPAFAGDPAFAVHNRWVEEDLNQIVRQPEPWSVVAVEYGQSLDNGDLIAMLEAMRMENRVLADRTGIVTSTAASVGMTVPPPQIARLTTSRNGARWGVGSAAVSIRRFGGGVRRRPGRAPLGAPSRQPNQPVRPKPVAAPQQVIVGPEARFPQGEPAVVWPVGLDLDGAEQRPPPISGLPAHHEPLRLEHFDELADDLGPSGHAHPDLTADGRVDDHIGAHPVRRRVFGHQQRVQLRCGHGVAQRFIQHRLGFAGLRIRWRARVCGHFVTPFLQPALDRVRVDLLRPTGCR